MSLSIDGTWKSGVWAETVWADGVWREGEYVFPDVVETRGGGIDHQIKRRKATLKERPNKHLDDILKRAEKEFFGELTAKSAPKEVQKKANKIVKKYAKVNRPKPEQVDWASLANDLAAVELLQNLYKKEILDKRLQDEADEANRLKLIEIENDNLEFLLMH